MLAVGRVLGGLLGGWLLRLWLRWLPVTGSVVLVRAGLVGGVLQGWVERRPCWGLRRVCDASVSVPRSWHGVAFGAGHAVQGQAEVQAVVQAGA